MTDLRKEARGRGCMVRLPNICNHNSETVVLCHIRMPGITGMGIKAPSDLLGAWACSACHDAIDRRAHMDLERDYVRLAHFEGMARTIAQLAKEGKI
ncbi:MAG: DUF1364 domain-containing protein [Oxalobacteraceae bacterium]|nr:DUF1364 domain-containing protein [Oxalobacteraceae bacterium]